MLSRGTRLTVPEQTGLRRPTDTHAGRQLPETEELKEEMRAISVSHSDSPVASSARRGFKHFRHSLKQAKHPHICAMHKIHTLACSVLS